MSVPIISFPPGALARLGLSLSDNIHYQSAPDELVQDTLRLGEGRLTSTGALAIQTGEFTGRSPKDKFTVKDEMTEDTVYWNNFNLPIDEKYFHVVHQKMMDYLNGRKELWIRDCYACADPRYRLNIRVVTEKPWISLFAHNMFLRPTEEELEDFRPEWHIISAPDLLLDPEECGTRQHNAAI
ncbi:MAG TPA: phosphoenolpyruvate carboxykinase (ATP), partial [Flavisolibacter sp.]|nr:phosphoenolpyruvate carboxykinase (ATP) [Flavisolibacter sp.]